MNKEIYNQKNFKVGRFIEMLYNKARDTWLTIKANFDKYFIIFIVLKNK